MPRPSTQGAGQRPLPVLRTHSPTGERIDEVEFHPAWHQLMDTAVAHGLTALPWTEPEGTGAHVRRAAGFLVWSQVEAGHLCPVSMTYAAVPALRANPELAAAWVPKLASREYDFGLRPLAGKRGAIAGMGMTEKQGGSDVRANTTRAQRTEGGPLGGGDTYRLTGHKWFMSAPMSDAFLVLAQTSAGPTCFLVPRVLDDGIRNPLALQRLKDKLGNRSNASSEVELDGTWGVRVGDEGRGVRTIIDMVAATRLDCVLGSTATMRQALVRAVHHARHRSAFGALLVDQPLMRNVLVDLALESEAATTGPASRARRRRGRLGLLPARGRGQQVLGLQAHGTDGRRGARVPRRQRLRRGERHGAPLPRGPAELHLGGSGNVNALDVLRAVTREPSVEAFAREVKRGAGHSAVLDTAIAEVGEVGRYAAGPDAPFGARRVVEACRDPAGVPAGAARPRRGGRRLRRQPARGRARAHLRHARWPARLGGGRAGHRPRLRRVARCRTACGRPRGSLPRWSGSWPSPTRSWSPSGATASAPSRPTSSSRRATCRGTTSSS